MKVGANDDDGGNNEIQRAKDFVVRVKIALGASSSEYRNFLHTLRMYKSKELSPTDVIVRMSTLFSGVDDLIRDELIEGFDAFLPPEYRISERGGRAGLGDVGGVDVDNGINGKEDEETDDESNRGIKDEVKRAAKRRIVDDNLDAGGRDGYSVDENDNNGHLGTKRPRPLLGDDDDSSASLASNPAAAAAAAADSRIKITGADIILSPPFIDPSTDLIHGGYNPVQIANRNRRDDDGNSARGQQPSRQQRTDDYFDGIVVECRLCKGKRDAVAIANNEPVLLCEQRGCNAEYHLGCLYDYRPRLFRANNKQYK